MLLLNRFVMTVCAARHQSKSYMLGLHNFPGTMASVCLV